MPAVLKPDAPLEPVVGRSAVLCMNSWAGRKEAPCRVIGETMNSWRIVVDADTRLPNRLLKPGERALVPKTAVRFMPPNAAVQPRGAAASAGTDGWAAPEPKP